jgi:uncharacterized protein (TIGR03435 family)
MKPVAIALAWAGLAFSQTDAFEVASLKPSPVESGSLAMAPDNPLAFTVRRATLRLLIAQAYDVLYDQVSGGPAWADSDRFDINAKAAGPATSSQKMRMLATLLAERFQLKLHREPGTLRAYALVAAKGGPKFGPQLHPPKEGDPRPTGAPGVLALRISMKQLAGIVTVYVTGNFPAPGQPPLSEPERLPVIDQTGLSGDYDISVDLRQSRDWFVVLEQQLGLKLEPRKVPIEMLIIDNAGKPSAN